MHQLELIAGKPFARVILFKDGKDTWPTLAEFEVRCQLRFNEATSSKLIANLHPFMTPSFQDDDIRVDWSMTGKQTRTLYDAVWGHNKTGYFNIIVSDTGATDERAWVVPTIEMRGIDITTRASGVS